MRRLLLASAVLLAAGAGVIALAVVRFSAPGPLPAAQSIVVPHGGLAAVASTLAGAGVIIGTTSFQIAAVVTWPEGPIHAAELEFPAHASLRTVLAVLRSGRAIQHRITFAEGLTAAQISQIMARTGDLAGEQKVPAEGAMFPDTYAFGKGETRSALIDQAQAGMSRVLAAEWAQRAHGLPLHSARDALILASIVEHEARLPAERPMIARVFLNRLAIGMRLQADPTSSYVASGGLGHLDRVLDHADLEHVDQYNTYVVPALPVGPICSPGLASIRAVLHPASGDALYFVADGAGGHLFTASLAVHDSNIAKLRAKRP